MWRFINADRGKDRQGRFDLPPHPDGDVLGRGIIETLNIVQAKMIDLLENGTADSFKIKKVDDKAGGFVNRAIDDDIDAVRMPMHAMATMRGRYFGQAMRRLEGK